MIKDSRQRCGAKGELMKKKWTVKRILLWLTIPFVLSLPFLLFMTLYFYDAGFSKGGVCERENKTNFFSKTICGLSHTYDEYAPYFRFLSSDEKMIRNFHKHRADFEQLVKIYREDFSIPTRLYILDTTPEVAAILKRSNVQGVVGDWILWIPPDPYSKEAREAMLKILYRKKLQHRFTSLEDRAYSGVIIAYSYFKVMRLYNGSKVSKDYYYIPFVPKIKNGYLATPIGDPLQIFPTLNTYPQSLRIERCVARQIEPQWFIRMCQ
jgi:hypothetical protein